MNWYIEVLKKYAVFSGRARRKEYWFFVLFSTIVSVLITVVDLLIGTYNPVTGAGILGGLYSLAIFIPYIAVTVRRLHDTDKSGWWILMPIGVIAIVGVVAAVLIPLAGESGSPVLVGLLSIGSLAAMIIMLVFLVSDSTPGANRYGGNPKNAREPVFDSQRPLQQFQQQTTINVNQNQQGNTGSVTLFSASQGTPSIILSPNMEVVVGRSSYVNVKIDNKYVSSKHLSLLVDNTGRVKVRDMSSSNGTYIDGKKLDPNIFYVLNAGERLVIGSEDVVYSL